MKMMYGTNRTRSANAPVMRPGVGSEHALETGEEKLGHSFGDVWIDGERILEHVMRSRTSDDAVLRRTEAQKYPQTSQMMVTKPMERITHHDGEHVGRAHQPRRRRPSPAS